MKICQKCYVEKEKEYFGKDVHKIDGFNFYCKECIKKRSKYQRGKNKTEYKKYSKEYREKNRELLKEKSKINYHFNWEKRREQARKTYSKHKEEIARKRAEKRGTEEGREKNRMRMAEWRKNNRSKAFEMVEKWRKANPEKANAHTLIVWATKTGLIKRNEKCEECEKVCKTEGHHEDYSKPLEVKWLCKLCHSKKHKIYR